MQERTKNKDKKGGFIPPTKKEIGEYLVEIKTNVRPLFAEEEIKPDTENVRIVNEKGKFLGWGKVGEYDWFYLKKKPNGRPVGHSSLHHRNSRAKFNMTMEDQPINIESDEMEKIINEITRQ